MRLIEIVADVGLHCMVPALASSGMSSR